MFEVAKAYEQRMGSWSKLLAPLFIEFVSIKGEILDVGCGTGSIAFAAAEDERVSKVTGLDRSTGFIEYARSRNGNAQITFEVGDAQNLPYADASFDRCLSSLMISFIPDAPKAASEMRRVTRPGGVVATCMWDNSGGMEAFQLIWDAAIALDPAADSFREKHLPLGSPDELSALWHGTGLRDSEVSELVISLNFISFNDLWRPSLEGQGPMGSYLAGLPADHREMLKTKVEQSVLGDVPDRAFTLSATAWAIRGTVP